MAASVPFSPPQHGQRRHSPLPQQSVRLSKHRPSQHAQSVEPMQPRITAQLTVRDTSETMQPETHSHQPMLRADLPAIRSASAQFRELSSQGLSASITVEQAGDEANRGLAKAFSEADGGAAEAGEELGEELDGAAVQDLSWQLERLELTPLQKLLKLCGQGVSVLVPGEYGYGKQMS